MVLSDSDRWQLRATASLVVGVVLLVAGCRLGQREMEDTTPVGCAECHVDITHQWEHSAHSIAWISPTFFEESGEREAEYCLPCHASQPLLEQSPGSEPRLRDTHRQFGVDCNVCHQMGCGYAGPYKNHIEAHPTEQDTTRLPCADFCGTCHRMELDQYYDQYIPSVDPGEASSCGGCHMPAYRSRLTQDHLLSYIHPKRIVRDHSFPVWTPTVSGCAVEVASLEATRTSSKRIRVQATLVNRGAGHSIPVGEFGSRELLVAVKILDDAGNVLGISEESVFADDENALRPQVETDFSFEVESPTASIALQAQLTVERVNDDRSFRYLFTTRQAAIPPGAIAE